MAARAFSALVLVVVLSSGCGPMSDIDAGSLALDAGAADAGAADAGAADAGTADAGTADAGTADAGVDGGAADAGFWRTIGPLPPSDFLLADVTWTGSSFVAVGGRSLANTAVTVVSTDGLSWSVHMQPAVMPMLMAVASNGQRHVAVGLRKSGGRTVWNSTDGATWSESDAGLNEFLHGVSWDGTRFWTVGQGGTIASSSDGLAWLSHASGTATTLFDVLSRGDVVVAVGGSGLILTSADGQVWTPTDAGTTRALHSIALDGTTFVVAGEAGVMLTSPDALTWTPLATGTTRTLRDVLVFDGGLVAVGETSATGGAAPILLSRDNGANWELSKSVPQSLWSVTVGPGRLVTVGAAGTVFVSP